MQSRYYNPDWGRFINIDGEGGQIRTLLSHNMFAYCFNNPINLEDQRGHFPSLSKMLKYATAALEVAGGIGLIAGGVAAIGFGLNHVYSGAYDIYNIYRGREEEIGKHNFIKNGLDSVFGEKVGTTAYYVSDFGIWAGVYAVTKVPKVADFVAKRTITVVNMKYNIANEQYSVKGINGLKNIFTTGWNVSHSAVFKAAKDIGELIGKFIKIF